MSSFPFLHVGVDYLRPPRRQLALNSHVPIYNWDFCIPILDSHMPPFPFIEANHLMLNALVGPSEARINPRPLNRNEAVTLPILQNLDEAPKEPIFEASMDPIFEAVRQNDTNSLIQVFKKRKRDPVPLSANNEKWTAFHLAASKPEYKECLELLLKYDSYSILVHRDNETNLGETALHIACKFGCEENVLILLQKGCDAGKKTNTGHSALHIAASKGYMKIVQHLLNYGVNIDLKDETGRTPLHLSAMASYLDTTGILLANGANILSLDKEGNLPLHLACKCGTFETVCLLLEHNPASLNDKNSDGITPFMLAISNFDVGCIQYLLKNGARTDVCDKLGRMALHFAASRDLIQSFSLLIQSINVNHVEQNWVSNTSKVLKHIPVRFPYKFDSHICLTIQIGLDYLKVLIKSHLPRSILQMPSLRQDGLTESILVFSPLAYLFFHFIERENMAFDDCLDLLLKHRITLTDDFQRVFQTKWPKCGIQFINPLSILFCSTWPNDNREHHFNLLIENNVTTDYCLQCYHNNDEPFMTFNEYKLYYCPVIYAVEKYNLEVVKLLISNSVILEPDVLCNYLIMAFTKTRNQFSTEVAEARNLYQYLINLKPVYYKWYLPFNQYNLQSVPFMPAAEIFSDEALAKFCGTPYNLQQSPIYAVMEAHIPSFMNVIPASNNLQPFPYISAAEEFANVTLQQLCRTAIRHQLREPTLEANLRNFRRNILELPLPNTLKDYLLFKN